MIYTQSTFKWKAAPLSKILTNGLQTSCGKKKLACEILRIKGVSSIKDNPQKFMIQGVVDNFDIKPSGFDWDNEPKINKFVFIGKHLNELELKKSFITECLTE